MKSLVIYASTSGNTKRIAESIADALRRRGSVELMSADDAPTVVPAADLIVIGGPTERHTLTEPMAHFLDRLAPESVRGTATAVFDTRLRWPLLLSGSAAIEIAKRLRATAARVVAGPESFIVNMKPELEVGEIDRAAAWASRVADAVEMPTAGVT
jgi:flavodoxin